MPHSSGGGSHGGGSHSASSRPSHVVSHHRMPGTSPYLYYRHGVPLILYANTDITGAAYRNEKRIAFFGALFFSLLLLFFAVLSCSPADKLTPYPASECAVIDNLDVIDNEDVLLTKLNEYADYTGMKTVVLTVSSSEFGLWANLENYAYSEYLSRFPGNERMWLIVYTEEGKGEWFFEGMQGDETDGVLPETASGRFNASLSSALDGGADVGDAFLTAFDDLLEYDPFTWHFGTAPVFVCGGLALFILIGAVIPLLQAHDIKKGGATKIHLDEGETVESMERVMCEYCRKKYIPRFHKACPFCGTPRTTRNANPFPEMDFTYPEDNANDF